MSISPTPKINADCLLLICEIITQQVPDPYKLGRSHEDGRPLNIIRVISQVCHGWRESLIASPWIWGRVIDLGIEYYDHRKQGLKRGQWMEEVVKRSGSAPLWIYGDVSNPLRFVIDPEFDSLSFFIRLLTLWERIEVLSVSIVGGTVMEIPDTLRTRFFSRAPILKHFEVLCPHWLESPDFQSNSSRKLFANHAPALQTMNAEDVPFSIDAPWISGIREMVPISGFFTIGEVIVLLQRMPMLEKFRLTRNFSAPDLQAPQPTVHLPNLNSIILTTSLTSAAKMMECVSMSRLSSLFIEIYISCYGPTVIEANPEILPAVTNAMSRYISNYFASKPSTNVSLTVKRKFFSFDDISAKHSGRRQSQKLDVRLHCLVSDGSAADIMRSILDALLVAITPMLGGNPGEDLFDPIQEITLDVAYAQLNLFPNLRSTFAVFNCIRVIWMDCHSVENLLSVCFPGHTDGGRDDHYDVIFPELQALCVTPRPATPVNTDLKPLIDFLLERKRIGFPVARLDLTNLLRSDSTPDSERLEGVDGLEVLWKQSTPESRDWEDGLTSRPNIKHPHAVGEPRTTYI